MQRLTDTGRRVYILEEFDWKPENTRVTPYLTKFKKSEQRRVLHGCKRQDWFISLKPTTDAAAFHARRNKRATANRKLSDISRLRFELNTEAGHLTRTIAFAPTDN